MNLNYNIMATYDNKPEIFEANGDGSYTYRWGILEVKFDSEMKTGTNWDCDEVIVWATVTSNAITQAVIDHLWGKDYEQKLLNDYNAAVFGMVEPAKAEKYINNYKVFLKERAVIKSVIDADCEVLKIR